MEGPLQTRASPAAASRLPRPLTHLTGRPPSQQPAGWGGRPRGGAVHPGGAGESSSSGRTRAIAHPNLCHQERRVVGGQIKLQNRKRARGGEGGGGEGGYGRAHQRYKYDDSPAARRVSSLSDHCPRFLRRAGAMEAPPGHREVQGERVTAGSLFAHLRSCQTRRWERVRWKGIAQRAGPWTGPSPRGTQRSRGLASLFSALGIPTLLPAVDLPPTLLGWAAAQTREPFALRPGGRLTSHALGRILAQDSGPCCLRPLHDHVL